MNSEILQAEYRRLVRESGLTIRDDAAATQTLDLAAEARCSAIAEGYSDSEADGIAQEFVDVAGPTMSFSPMLQRYAEDLEAKALGLGIRVRRPYLIAEFPTGESNACVVPVSGGAALILVNFGLLMLLFQVAKIRVLGLNFCRSGDDRCPAPGSEFGASGINVDQTTAALATTVYNYVAHRDPTRAVRFRVLVGEWKWWLEGMVHHCERFIVAHEFAHLLCGHLDDSDYRDVAIKGCTARAYEYRRRMELEADALALRCCMQDIVWPRGEGASWVAAGAIFPFGLHKLVDKVQSLHWPGANVASDHPTADDRIAAIRSDIFAKYGGAQVWSRAENALLWLESYGDEIVRQTQILLSNSGNIRPQQFAAEAQA